MASKGALIIRIAGDVRDLGRATGKAANQLEGIAKAAGIAGAAAGAALVAGVAGSISMDKANDKLAAGLGLSEKRSAEVGKVAGTLYKNAYGDSIEGVNDAVGAVMTSIDGMSKASSGRLEDVTAKALDFASAFDVDVTRATQVAGQVMRTGLAKNATEAFDLLTTASQNVPVSLREDVLDAADEYGQFFAGIGLSGEETFSALVKGAEKGQFGIDKIGDAVKEFTIRSTDMSTSSKDAYKTIGLDAEKMAGMMVAGGDKAGEATQKIVDGLLGMKPGAEQANAAIALFGTPLEDLSVQEIPEFLKQLHGGGDAMKDFSGSTKRMGDTLNDNASTNLESFKRQVTTGFIEIIGGKVLPIVNEVASTLATEFGPAVKSVTEWMKKNKDIVQPLAVVLGTFVGIITAIVAATKVWAAIQTVLNVVMAANPIGLLIIAIAALVAGLVFFFTKTKLGQKLWKDFTGFLGSAFSEAGEVIGNVWTWIKESAGAAWDWIKSYVFSPIRWYVNLIIEVFKLYGRIAATVWNGVKEAVGAAWSWLKDKVFKPILWFVDLVIAGFKAYWSVVKTVWNAVKDAVGKVWNWIKEKVFQPIQLWIEILKIAFGIFKDKASEVWEKVKGAIGTAWNWIKEKVFYPIQKWIVILKLAFGILKDKVSEIWSKIKDRISSGWGKIKTIFNKLKSIIKETIPEAFRKGRDAIGRAWDAIKKKAAKPINFVIDTVYNKGIRKWVGKVFDFFGKKNPLPVGKTVNYANGGVENHTAQIARAGAMRMWAEPETGGEAYIPLAQSKRGRSTAILSEVASRFGLGLTKFAKGGFWDDPLGTVVSGAKSLVSGAANAVSGFMRAVTDPFGYARQKITDMVGDKFTGRAGAVTSMLREMPKMMIGGIGQTFKDRLTGIFGGGGTGKSPFPATGMIYHQMEEVFKKLIPGVVVTSGYRPGSRVAGYGNLSQHALGRALDLVGGPGLSKIFDILKAKFGMSLKELLYTPKGAGQIIQHKLGATSGITAANHYSHVHASFANGGLIPGMARGGLVKARPGGTIVRLGEGGYDETVTPVAGPHAPRGGSQPINITVVLDGREIAKAQLDPLRKEIAKRGGNVQLTLGSGRR